MNCQRLITYTLISTTLAIANVAQAGSSAAFEFCDRNQTLSASDQSTLLHLASVVRQELANSNSDIALISRSGLNLSRFNIRYSHAAIAWRENNSNRWTARQLYYACDEKRPRIYDQGLAGFVMGTDDPNKGYISIVPLPSNAATPLKHVALDTPTYALNLLANNYSASAYAFGLEYQNCNQWVIELLATAWGNLSNHNKLRSNAQTWLKTKQYRPQPITISSWLLLAAAFAPLVHTNDHPEEDLQKRALHISLPSDIETFIRQEFPNSPRIEICHNGQQAIVRHGWTTMDEDCTPTDPRDKSISFSTQ